MTKESGIITDFDNTLVATNSFVEKHLRITCQKIGISVPSHEALRTKFRENPPFEKIFTDLFGDSGKEILIVYRENAMETFYEETPNGNLFVRAMFDQGVPIVIVSNRVNKLEERLVQAGYNPGYFLAILKVESTKPDQKAYNPAIAILEEKEIPKSGIKIFGDHTDDYQACPEDLKPNFIAVLTGLTTAEEFEKAGVANERIWQKLEPQNLLTI
jgi:beta-phosphoglucomutase-like phosphatase (HAD superfamily)